MQTSPPNASLERSVAAFDESVPEDGGFASDASDMELPFASSADMSASEYWT